MSPRLFYVWFVILVGVTAFRSTLALRTDRKEFPWLVRVLYDYQYKCGGAIVNKNTVLTSTVCLRGDHKQKLAPFHIFAGDYNFDELETSEQTIPVRFIKKKKDHDIAVLKLEKNLVFNEYVQPIKMADFLDEGILRNNQKCYYSGIGEDLDGYSTISKRTKKYKVTLQSSRFCKRNFNYFSIHRLCSTDDHDRNQTPLHYGAPLTCYKKSGEPFLVGFVTRTRKTREGLTPYTRIAVFYNWVNGYM